MEYAELNENEAREILVKSPVALLPVGAVEDHGAHLPLGTDTFLATGIAKMVDCRLENSILLPPVYYGQVWSLRNFSGSININDDVLTAYIVNIGQSLFLQGVKTLCIINSHVGNISALKNAARQLFEQYSMKIFYLTYPGAEQEISKVCKSERPHYPYFHACEIETSYMLYISPERVNMEKAVKNVPVFPKDFDYTPTPWSEIMKTAVMGDPTLATAEKGKAIIDEVVDNIVKILN
jgi:creatinine amidohydrolase